MESTPASKVPSIKGSVFGLVLEDLRKLVAEGEISREDIEAQLEGGDLVYLEVEVAAIGWYDIRAYGRVLELLRDTVGGGRNEYLCARGARSAEALMERGMYQQMDYLSRTQLSRASDPQERFLAFGRDLKLLGTLSDSIYNFGESVTLIDPDHSDRYVVEFRDAEAFPEVACWTAVGFRNRMAEAHDTPDLWFWERPRPDLVLYRMNRPV